MFSLSPLSNSKLKLASPFTIGNFFCVIKFLSLSNNSTYNVDEMLDIVYSLKRNALPQITSPAIKSE